MGQGKLDDAVAAYRQAVGIKPDYAEAYSNLGNALLAFNRFEESLASYNDALALRPDFAEVYSNRGAALRELGQFEESRESYTKALALKPDLAVARFALCMAELPVLYADAHDVMTRRAAYERRLRDLCSAWTPGAGQSDLAKAVGSSQPFYLAYQGFNDRDLQALYGSFVCRIMAERYPPVEPAPPPEASQPVRVGIVSGFFRSHSNWKLPIKGWLRQLDRQQFRIFGYHTGARRDAETEAAAALCDRFIQGPLPGDRWRAEILADAPHVLIYPEIGMDAVAVALAAQRLAAVQCNSWGHPDTSGLPTLDYYLSSDLMEPPDGQDHYTERLIRLPNLSVYCEPIESPPIQIARRDLGLRSSATACWCGQSLFKYLPQFDDVFPRIARAAGDCQFVFIEDVMKSARITEFFRQRLNRAFTAFGLRADAYCLFLPRMDQQKFIAATGQCDVFLDSIGWSGCNSMLESLPHDLPIVTMPGSLMRGRHGMAILKIMGVTDTIVETINDYVSTAVRLARDVPWRSALKAKIAAGKHRLYYDKACISELEQFLDRVGRRLPLEIPRR
jgi:predicted O-linked N-acetylglucosamine transferase (SPINDLY family)